jgi:broad specificity phosphatase PhoE
MAVSGEILLVRHGETDDNAAARFQGRLDTRLNTRGREQAHALALTLRDEGLRALYASPLLRAQETAQIVGDALGIRAELDERLVEADAGSWTGRAIAEIVAEQPDEFDRWRTVDRTFRFPAGESVAEQAERMAAALAEIAGGPLPALVVTHGGTIRAVDGLERPGDGRIGNCVVFRLAAPASSRP